MIGETSRLVNQLNADRVYKENVTKSANKENEESVETPAGSVADTATFSPQALALAKQVAPATESPAEEQVEAQGRGQEDSPGDEQVSRFLDIRV